jgi:hypothetical protein
MVAPDSKDTCCNSESSTGPVVCRKECGGPRRASCYLSLASRVAVVPLVWWGIFGFGSGQSGTMLLRDRLGLSAVPAAALMAVLLAAVSLCSLLPCRIHKRIMARRRVSLEKE